MKIVFKTSANVTDKNFKKQVFFSVFLEKTIVKLKCFIIIKFGICFGI